jgi:hypothetical protein
MSMKNFNDTIGNRSRDLPVCSAVSQPLRHRVFPIKTGIDEKTQQGDDFKVWIMYISEQMRLKSTIEH